MIHYRKPFRRLHKPWEEKVFEGAKWEGKMFDGARNEYLDLVNEIVPRAPGVGAYFAGLLSCRAWDREQQPDRQLLEAAVKCSSLTEADEVFDRWLNLKRDQVLERR